MFLFLASKLTGIEKFDCFQIPKGCNDLHHEVELAVVIGSECRDASEESAMSHVAGYALALDMTARDIQEQVTPYKNVHTEKLKSNFS